jgi:hypothetical protein
MITLLVQQVQPKNNSPEKVGLYVFLLQCTKIKAVVLWPGEICDSEFTPPPNMFSLRREVTQNPPLSTKYDGSAVYEHCDVTGTMANVFRVRK